MTSIITLSTGTKVDVKDPSCLLYLTKEELEELKQVLNQRKVA